MPTSAPWRRLRAYVFPVACTTLLAAGQCPNDPLMNDPPEADIEVSQEVSVGLPVKADGTGSTDANGDDLFYFWDLQTPEGSSAELVDDGLATPSFTPDVPGDYVLTLEVSDSGGLDEASVTITASDNSASATIDETGGEIVSSDGRLRVTIPADALTAETEITITLAAPSQFTEAIGELDIPAEGIEVFDLQPSGLTFQEPATASISVEGAYSVTSGSYSAAPAQIFADVGSADLAPLENKAMEPHATTPTDGLLTGGLQQISTVGVIGGLSSTFRNVLLQADPPSQAQVDVDFVVDVTATVFPDPYTDYALESATANDGSVAPVVPSPAGTAFLPTELTSRSASELGAVLDYRCEAAGSGTWISNVAIEGSLVDAFGFNEDNATVSLVWPIECIAPAETTERAVGRATWVSPGVAGDEILIGGTDPERWFVTSGTVTSLGGFFGGEAIHHVYPIGSGLYANTVLGKSWSWNAVDDWELILQPTNDHALQFSLGEDGTLYGASGLRTPRTVSSTFELNEYAYNYVQAYWSDGTDDVLIITSGDGNAAFNESLVAVADVEAGTTATTLTGVMDVVLDQYQILTRELACTRLPAAATRLVCVFTGGETSPGTLVSGQPDRDGYYEIFEIDLTGPAATSLESGRIATVGATARSEGGSSRLTFMNQETSRVEIRQVGVTGIESTQSILVVQTCSHALDMTVTPSGQYAVASCLGEDGAGGADDKYVGVELP